MAGSATLTIEPSIVATPEPRIAATSVKRWRRVIVPHAPGSSCEPTCPGYDRLMAHSAPSKGWALRSIGRVVAGDAREHFRRRPASYLYDLPRSPHEIGPKWVTAVLCGGHPEARVTFI